MISSCTIERVACRAVIVDCNHIERGRSRNFPVSMFDEWYRLCVVAQIPEVLLSSMRLSRNIYFTPLIRL